MVVLFGSFGKAAKDLISKGYHHDMFKVNINHKEKNLEISQNVNLETAGERKVAMDLEGKYKISDDMTLNENWTSTTNTIDWELAYTKDRFKIAPKHIWGLSTGEHKFAIKANYAQADQANMEVVAELVKNEPLVSGQVGIALGHHGGIDWTIGGQLGANAKQQVLTKWGLGLQVAHRSYVASLLLSNGSTFESSIHQKVNMNFRPMEIATKIGWDYKTYEATYALAFKHSLNETTSVQAAFNHKAQLKTTFKHKLSDEVKLTASAHIEAAQWNAANVHKLGFGLDVNV